MATPKKSNYAEPSNYFPPKIRKKFKLGEYNDSAKANAGKKAPAKKPAPKKGK